MNTIQQKVRFSVHKNPEFIKELRQNVNDYFQAKGISRYGNWKLTLKTIFMLSLYILPFILMTTGIITSFAGVLACWVLIGFGKAGVGMGIMHDANHHTYSKNTKINNWMGKTMYLVGGFPANWKHQHNTLHHGYTNIEGHDEDISPVGILRISPHKPLKKFHRFQHLYAWFFYSLMTLLWITSKDFVQLERYRKKGAFLSNTYSYRQLRLLLIGAKVLYYAVFVGIPLLTLPFAWYWIIVFFLSMHLTAGFILTVVFQAAHVVPTSDYPLPDGEGHIENNWAVHQLLTTSNFAPNNRLLSWFLGGLNYQVEHHLFPNISHVHYRNISNLVKAAAHKYSLPYYVQPGFLRAVWSHAVMLKKLGRA
jgi:linoleoyl-CoA desaturase